MIVFTAPLVVALYQRLVHNESLPRYAYGAMGISVLGLALAVLGSGDVGTLSVLGIGLAVLTMVSYSERGSRARVSSAQGQRASSGWPSRCSGRSLPGRSSRRASQPSRASGSQRRQGSIVVEQARVRALRDGVSDVPVGL